MRLIEKGRKESVPRNHKNSVKNRLASQREITKRKRTEEAAQRVNSKRNFSINPKMAEETAKEAAQRVNSKRLAVNRESKKRKRAKESQEQRKNRLASQREITKKTCREISRTT